MLRTLVLTAAAVLWSCAPEGAPTPNAAADVANVDAAVPVPADPAPEPASLHLDALFDADLVEGELPEITDLEVFDWRFDRPWEPLPEPEPESESDPASPAADAPPPMGPPAGDEEVAADEGNGKEEEDPALSEPGELVHGVEAFVDVEDLAVEDGILTGRCAGKAILLLPRAPEGKGRIHGVEVRLKVTAGTEVGLLLGDDEVLERADTRRYFKRLVRWPARAPITPGEEFQTVLVPLGPFGPGRLEEVRRVYVNPSDAEDASFAIESVRLVSEREHLAGQAANLDWRGLGEVYRQTLMMHATESVHFDVSLPSRPWLDLAVGTLEGHPTTFQVHVTPTGGAEPVRVLRRTVTRPDRWEEVPVELAAWAGRDVRLTFSLDCDHAEQVGYFGTPVVRNRQAPPQAFGEPVTDAPQGVIFILADTLRRDHLDAYGYRRPTAPFLAGLARDGALFQDTISQGSWTKVSVPSILSSLYPTSSGVTDMTGKLPFEITTLAEVFQEAGHATMATSSVPFSGKASNLQQGVDVLHEAGSVGDLGHEKSKNARTYVDRVAAWLEPRREQPFFVFLHVFDPHSPFEPYDPYEGLFADPAARERHEEVVKKVQEHWKEADPDEDVGDLPDQKHLEAVDVSVEEFVAREKDWYDESIRAMDAEMARLMERLEDLGLKDQVLLVFTSDHGEEFLEHGRHFHGKTPYGEMTNVPLLLWGPRWVPGGTVVPQTVQSLDVYPTVVELSGLPVPERAQGQSLVPLLQGTGGFRPRPAVTEQRPMGFEEDEDALESFAMVSGGYRLVHHVTRPEDHPEFELYDHVNDPLNLTDIAADHPEVVAKMAEELALWRKWAEASRVGGAEAGAELTEEELADLAGLGYVK